MLDPKLLIDALSQAVSSSLKIGSKSSKTGCGQWSGNSGFVSKPYLEKPHPSQLAPEADGWLNTNMEFQYCKDTGHLRKIVLS